MVACGWECMCKAGNACGIKTRVNDDEGMWIKERECGVMMKWNKCMWMWLI